MAQRTVGKKILTTDEALKPMRDVSFENSASENDEILRENENGA